MYGLHVALAHMVLARESVLLFRVSIHRHPEAACRHDSVRRAVG